MLKKTITYTDYDGNERTEHFYFNLTEDEIISMELSAEGGLSKKIENIVSAQNNHQIYKLFREMIINAYGEKSPDGRRFMKSKEITDNFLQTEAFSVLIRELGSNAETAQAFVNGIIPQKAQKK